MHGFGEIRSDPFSVAFRTAGALHNCVEPMPQRHHLLWRAAMLSPFAWAPLSVGSPLGAFKKGTSFVCHPTVRPVCTTDPRLRTTHPSSIPRPVACADSIRARSLQACVIPRNAIAAGPTRRFYTQGTAEPAAQRRLVGTPEQGSTKHGLHNNTALLRDSLHFRQFGPPWVF